MESLHLKATSQLAKRFNDIRFSNMRKLVGQAAAIVAEGQGFHRRSRARLLQIALFTPISLVTLTSHRFGHTPCGINAVWLCKHSSRIGPTCLAQNRAGRFLRQAIDHGLRR